MNKQHIEEIIRTVCQKRDIDYNELIGKSRKTRYVWHRHSILHFLRETTPLGYEELGEALGRHHATAIHSQGKAEDLYQTDSIFRKHHDAVGEIMMPMLKADRKNPRHFIVFYKLYSDIMSPSDGHVPIKTEGKYVNPKIISESINKPSHRIIINNILELSEKDYMDWVNG